MGIINVSADDVEHVVHAVDEIDIGVAGGAEHDFRAIGAAFGGVAGEVVRTDVGFSFHDAGAKLVAVDAVDEDFAEKIGGNNLGRAVVESS